MQSIQDTPLRLSRTEVESICGPYISKRTTKADPVWQAKVSTFRWRTRKALLKRLVGLGRRDSNTVLSIYGEQWQRIGFDNYAPPRPGSKPWEWGDDAYLMHGYGGARARLLYLMRVIEWLKPTTVLEVGCGHGVNLLPLACRFPDVKFTGLELTAEGIAAAQAIQREATIPAALEAFSPTSLIDPAAHRRIEFIQGSAAAMPFPDRAFDFVYSSLALEQMESIRSEALAEFVRVASRHTAMLEPFREANSTGFQRDFMIAQNYFRGSVAELPSYGLHPILITDDMPAEAWLRPCLVVCKKDY